MTPNLRQLTTAVFVGVTVLASEVGILKAQENPNIEIALQISKEISGAALQGDIELAATKASSVASASPEAFRTAFSGLAALGKGQYADLVYARTYGRTEQDVIYKLRFEKNVVFMRYLFHVDAGKWKLFDLTWTTETGVAFPRNWQHIYPQ